MSVGIAGLEGIFRSWQAAGKRGSDLSRDQVIQEIRKHNYIPPRAEAEYAEAIRARYAACCEQSSPR